MAIPKFSTSDLIAHAATYGSHAVETDPYDVSSIVSGIDVAKTVQSKGKKLGEKSAKSKAKDNAKSGDERPTSSAKTGKAKPVKRGALAEPTKAERSLGDLKELSKTIGKTAGPSGGGLLSGGGKDE